MNTKEQVLELLERNKGKHTSGEELASGLGVTRAAVWKAVKSLERDGHTIQAVQNKGYALAETSNILSAQGIAPFLSDPAAPCKLHVFKTLESTNKTAKEMAVAGSPHGTVVLANQQTAGRGRYGRSFYSPPESGLYMSVILRTPLPGTQSSTLITAAAAVAVCLSITAVTGLEPVIKWVNDIYLNGKKVCGILTEAMTGFESGSTDWVVVGIGVNITTDDFSGELRDKAGALMPGTCGADLRNRIAAEIINRLLNPGSELTGSELISEYKRRVFVLGQAVTVIQAGDSYQADALDIDGEGRLIVRKQDGSIAALSSGEVSVKPVSS